MSRSYRRAIIKDRPRNYKKSTIYWRTVRRVINQKVNQLKYYFDEVKKFDMMDEDEILRIDDTKSIEDRIPNPKVIVNDYDYSDYTFDDEHDNSERAKQNKQKLRRK